MNTLNKKAFTLVELLSVVVLLGVISIIIIPNITKLLTDSKTDLYNNQIEVIKVAAKLWTSNEENKLFLINNQEWPYVITLGDLQDGAYIDKDIKNPLNDELFSDSMLIYINYENNQYTYQIDENTVDGNSQIITLLGDKSYSLEVKSDYIEPGVSAKDLNNNDISENIEVKFYKNGLPVDNIDTTTLSNYTIKYSVSYFDLEGNANSAVAFRRVKVVDTTAPVIVCSECTSNIVQVESTSTYILPEVTATDNYDGSVFISKIGSFSTIIPGKRKIVYFATDSSGNSASLEINFDIQDTIAPVIDSITQIGVEGGYLIYVIDATDSGSGIKEYSIDGGLTWQKSNKINVPLGGTLRNLVVKDNAGNISSSQQKDYYSKEFAYTGSEEVFIVPATGYYKIEAWGAQGGAYTTYVPGNGAYTSGYIYLEKDEVIHVNVGGQGSTAASSSNYTDGGYNGGGKANYEAGTGGGATDFRYGSNTLNDRIMVAAGGGGTGRVAAATIGGHGGSLIGVDGGDYNASSLNGGSGGTQIAGGLATTATTAGTSGSLGIGGNGGYNSSNAHGSGAGGGGYYGGGGGSARTGGGGGGSSYISGYTGCVAITSSTDRTPKTGCDSDTTDITCSHHFSGKIFIKTRIKPGNEAIPTHDGTGIMIGNTGNGFAKITYMEPQEIVFKDGTPVYYDIAIGAVCTNYHEDNSITGYNGTESTKTTDNQNSCLKFYAFNDDKENERVNLLLDHNTTSQAYWTNSSSPNNRKGPIDTLNQLYLDTSSWKGTEILKNYTLYQENSDGTKYGDYTIEYNPTGTENDYKARLIRVQELAEITGADQKEGLMFDEKTTSYSNNFYFDSLTTSPHNRCKKGSTSACNYGWLYDRTSATCIERGCLNNATGTDSLNGYWTATSAFGSQYVAWAVRNFGLMDEFDVKNQTNGVRPVIEVLKVNLIN